MSSILHKYKPLPEICKGFTLFFDPGDRRFPNCIKSPQQWVNYFAKIHKITWIAVPPQFTTIDCSVCGAKVYKTLSTRTHQCPHCQTVLDRDWNVAINILKKGLKYWGADLNGTVGQTETDPNDWGESGLWVFNRDVEDLSCLVEPVIPRSDSGRIPRHSEA